MKSELTKQLRGDEGERACVYATRDPFGKVAAFSMGQPS